MSNKNAECRNIEYLITKISYELVHDVSLKGNEIDKLLGILSRDGVYALWVYTIYKLKDEKLAKLVNKLCDIFLLIQPSRNLNEDSSQESDYSIKALKELNKKIEEKFSQIDEEENENEKKKLMKDLKKELEELKDKTSEYLQNISDDIHKLLFLKQILERTLIYARYHAKASEE